MPVISSGLERHADSASCTVCNPNMANPQPRPCSQGMCGTTPSLGARSAVAACLLLSVEAPVIDLLFMRVGNVALKLEDRATMQPLLGHFDPSSGINEVPVRRNTGGSPSTHACCLSSCAAPALGAADRAACCLVRQLLICGTQACSSAAWSGLPACILCGVALLVCVVLSGLPAAARGCQETAYCTLLGIGLAVCWDSFLAMHFFWQCYMTAAQGWTAGGHNMIPHWPPAYSEDDRELC